MSNMSLKDFVVEYSELLDEKEFEKVFETAAVELSRGDRTKLIKLLDSMGLNVSQDMKRIDGEYFSATDITKFVVAEGVTTLDENAFAYCSTLKDISIPNTVTSIGDWAFYGCSSLTKVVIPDSVTRIGEGAFYNCTSLTNVEIPDSMTSIGYQAFSYCSSLTSVTIGNSVKIIDAYAFRRCNGLTSITIPTNVTNIERAAFWWCESLKNIAIPSSINSIGEGAFDDLGTDVVINFDGTKEQWKNIYNSEAFTNTYFTVNCLDGTLHKEG